MAGYFEDVIPVAAVTHRVEWTRSVGPDSVDAADFEQEIFWFVEFLSMNSEMFFDFDGLADVHIQGAGKKFFSGGSLEHFGILVHAAGEVL